MSWTWNECYGPGAGCYVPAAFFSCPVIDGVYARIGTGDSIETNASTFMVEMRVRPPQSTSILETVFQSEVDDACHWSVLACYQASNRLAIQVC